jgi:hypothetical protein
MPRRWTDVYEVLGQSRPPVTRARAREGVCFKTAEHGMGGGHVLRWDSLIVRQASQTGEWQGRLDGCQAAPAAGSGGQSDR